MGRVHHCVHMSHLFQYLNDVHFFHQSLLTFVIDLEVLNVTEAAITAAVTSLGRATDNFSCSVTPAHSNPLRVVYSEHSMSGNLLLNHLRAFLKNWVL